MKKKGLEEKPHLKKKKRSCPVREGHRSTHQVDRVWLGFCTSRSFVLPELIQHRVNPPGRAGFNNQG